MPGFAAERSYTVYEDHNGFYVRKKNPDDTWQKAYVKQAHLEAFLDHGDQAPIPVDVAEDKYQDADEEPNDGNYASPERITNQNASNAEPKQNENFFKMEFDELNLGDLDPSPTPTNERSPNDEKENEKEDDITRYNKKGVLPKIDTRRHYKPSGGDVKIINKKPKWRSTPKIDIRRDYEPSGGNVEIVNEKLKWETTPKVDSKRQNYKPKGGKVDIVDEKVSWHARPRIEANNENYKPKASEVEIVNQRLEWNVVPKVEAQSDHKPGGGNVDIINEKLNWEAAAKVGSITSHVPGGGNVEIASERLNWKASPRIDAKQNDYAPGGGDVEIVSERLQWNSQQKIDAHNKEYTPGGGNIAIIDSPVKVRKVSKTESLNPTYERPTGKAEIVNEVLRWDARPRIDASQEDYSPGGGRTINIVDERLVWDSKPKIEALNPNYAPQIRNIPIFNERPNWNSNPKIDSQNQNYTRPERKDFQIHNKKGYDWDKEKPLRKMNSLQNIRWLPVVENVVFDPVKRRWVAAAKVAEHLPEGEKNEPVPLSELQQNHPNNLYKSQPNLQEASDTSSIQSSQTSRQEKKVKKRQSMPDLSVKSDFLYGSKENKGYGLLMRDRRKQMPLPEEVKQTMRELREKQNENDDLPDHYTKAEKPKINKKKQSKSSHVEVLNMDSLYKYSKINS